MPALTDAIEAEIKKGEALCEKATPGPWRANQSDDDKHLDWIETTLLSGAPDHISLVGKRGGAVAEIGRSDLEQQNADSEFIAETRTAYPAALALLKQAKAEIEKLRRAMREISDMYGRESMTDYKFAEATLHFINIALDAPAQGSGE